MSRPEAINRVLASSAPALHAALSPLGRRAFYPPDIPVQAQEARDAELNGTIGVFTDGHGRAVPLPSMAAALDLSDVDTSRAFLYSPVSGFPEVRDLWRLWQRGGFQGAPVDNAVPSTLPLVTCGLAHGLSLVADLFGGEGRAVAVGTPFWGNYRQTFAVRTGAELREAPSYRKGRFDPRVLTAALAGLPAGEPAVGILNFPSNPGGYSPSNAERRELVASVLEIAAERPFVVVLDEAYAGLAYEDGISNDSLFWELAGAHEQLIPVKVDGATKEFFFFGGRVGFLTFALPPGSEVAEALESKLKGLIRSTVGSPSASSQMLLLQALRGGEARREIDAVRQIGRQRWQTLKPLLDALDPAWLRPLPFNAGFFALLELPEELGITADAVRRHLIEHYSTGIVSIGERYLRLAICSVAQEALPEMMARIEQGVRELAGGGGGAPHQARSRRRGDGDG